MASHPHGENFAMKPFGNIMQLLVVLVASSATGICQSGVEVGVRGGIPFNAAFQSQINSPFRSYTSERAQYSVGPTVRVPIIDHVAVQLDAIYTHSRWDRSDAPGYYGDVLLASGYYDRWDFPILATAATSG